MGKLRRFQPPFCTCRFASGLELVCQSSSALLKWWKTTSQSGFHSGDSRIKLKACGPRDESFPLASFKKKMNSRTFSDLSNSYVNLCNRVRCTVLLSFFFFLGGGGGGG